MSTHVQPQALLALITRALDIGGNDGAHSKVTHRYELARELGLKDMHPHIADAVWAAYSCGRMNAVMLRRSIREGTRQRSAQRADVADLRAAMAVPLTRLHGQPRPTPEDDFLR